MVGDAQHRVALAAMAEGFVGVRRRRPGDGVGVGLLILLGGLGLASLHLPVKVVLVPGDLALAHPERFDLYGMLRPLVGGAALLLLGAAHEEGAAGDGHHLEGNLGPGDFLDVALVLQRVNLGTGLCPRVGRG
jgi:hypothetical protein